MKGLMVPINRQRKHHLALLKRRAISFLLSYNGRYFMTPELLLECVQKYNTLIGTQYEIHIGHCGKLENFKLSLYKEDCHHLMGLHHLKDRSDRKSRSRIFDELSCQKNQDFFP